jgi:hypothetical protein
MSSWINIFQRIIQNIAKTIKALWIYRIRYYRISRSKPPDLRPETRTTISSWWFFLT